MVFFIEINKQEILVNNTNKQVINPAVDLHVLVKNSDNRSLIKHLENSILIKYSNQHYLIKGN